MSEPTTKRADLGPQIPQIDWSQSGGPRADAFDDIYYSAIDGLAETEAVFLKGSRLERRFAALQPGEHCVIGELGFGTGLNLLAAWRLWRTIDPHDAHLHFVSVEAAPLNANDMKRAHASWPELAALSRRLTERLPPPIKGVHRRQYADDRLTLTLAYLPVEEALSALEFTADVWFLDGFAPARNPQMWRQAVLTAVGARTKPGGAAATYTVAGAVRRALEAAGFAVSKQPGFGSKRERLEAIRTGAPVATQARRAPFYPRAHTQGAKTALVIGAGLAGAFTANALHDAGLDVTVLDARHPACGASGNPAGLVMPRLDLDDRPIARFHRCAFAHALDRYAAHPDAFDPIGVAELALSDTDAERATALCDARALPAALARALDQDDAHRAGAPTDARGLMFPTAGLARPRALVEALLADVHVRHDHRVTALEATTTGWLARDGDANVIGQADCVVVCAGPNAARFAQTAALKIIPSRGQISWARLRGAPPAHGLTFGGYAAPFQGGLMFGATYDAWDEDTDPSADDASTASNLSHLAEHAPDLAAHVDHATLQGRASLRATTPDRLALMGPVPDAQAFAHRFAGLKTGLQNWGDDPGPTHHGLYVLGGLGSRGLVWAPLLAEALASELTGAPGAVERGAGEALHPARQLVRALKRQR